MRRWGMRLAWLLLLPGCDALFHIDEFQPLDAAVDAPPDASSGCPASYFQLGSGFYRFEATGMGWVAAEAACAADGAGSSTKHTHLLVGESVELAAVFNYLLPTRTGKAWIGLNDGTSLPASCGAGSDGFYQWVTDEPLPVAPAMQPPWYPGDPQFPCVQYCVQMLPDMPAIDDNSCGNPWVSICECDAFAEDHSHF